MASDQEFVDYVVGQIENAGDIKSRKMFGEYAVYADGKVVLLICDNNVFVKPTEKGREFIGDVTEASPYPGAKPAFLITEQVENQDWFSELIRISWPELNFPKKKKKKK